MSKKTKLAEPARIVHRRHAISSFKNRANANRTLPEKIADTMTELFGTMSFLIANGILFTIWFAWNTSLIPGLTPLDPFPFELLTMIVSLEAIFLSIVVLISQNRAAHIAELREEIDLYINTFSEAEITKIIYLQTLLLEKHGIDLSKDKELQVMLKTLESDKIEHELEKQLKGM